MLHDTLAGARAYAGGTLDFEGPIVSTAAFLSNFMALTSRLSPYYLPQSHFLYSPVQGASYRQWPADLRRDPNAIRACLFLTLARSGSITTLKANLLIMQPELSSLPSRKPNRLLP